MSREPDWEALNQLNFMLTPRVSVPLNEALNALALADMPENEIDPQVWRDKAKVVIGNLLHLYQAWTALIQYKNGIKMPPTAIRSFPVQALLDWLTVQLGLIPPARAKHNFNLKGNQPSIQEALLLLYTVSVTQGTEVHLIVDADGWRKLVPHSFCSQQAHAYQPGRDAGKLWLGLAQSGFGV